MESAQDRPERQSDVRPDADELHQAALLIDFDNVTMGIRSNLGQELRNLLNSDVIRGKVAVQRAYADWRRYPQYIVPLSEASIDLIFAPAYGSSKKNATDIRLAIDALELVFTRPEIKTFILMSGDSDFSSLVLKLKEYGKYVIGVGIQESSSDLLVQNCDEYYSYSALSGLSKAGEDTGERHDPWVLTEKAVQRMVERGDTMRSDRLKQVMLEMDANFNEKEQGFNKFNRFVVEAASRGLLSIQRMENGQYGVGPGEAISGSKAEGGGKKTDKPEGRRSRRGKARPREERQRGDRPTEGRSARRGREKLTMESALQLLDRALAILLQGNAGPVRDSDVKRRMLELDDGFDEGELGFSKFSKFLVAAEEAGAVSLSRGPNGNYQVSRAQQGAGKKSTPTPADRVSEKQRGGAEKVSAVQRLARFFFGPEAPEGQPKAGKRQAEAPGARPARAERKPASRSAARRRGGGRTQKGEAPGSDARARKGPRGRRAQSPEAKARRSPRGRKGRRGDGRNRREEVGAASGANGGVAEAARPEPEVTARRDEPRADSPPAQRREPEAPAAAAPPAPSGDGERAGGVESESGVKPAPLPDAPRGTIRGRWGTRGRYRPAKAPPPLLQGQTAAAEKEIARGQTAEVEGEGAAAARVEAGAAASPEERDAIVSHLRTRYSGVGEKTAEALVDAFGNEVFRVLDQEPDRIRAVLSERRAERVLAARREELEAGK